MKKRKGVGYGLKSEEKTRKTKKEYQVVVKLEDKKLEDKKTKEEEK